MFHKMEFPYATMVSGSSLPATTVPSSSNFEDDDWLLAPVTPANKEDKGSISEDKGSMSEDRGTMLADKGIIFDDTANGSDVEYDQLADTPFTYNDTDDRVLLLRILLQK